MDFFSDLIIFYELCVILASAIALSRRSTHYILE